MSVRRHTARIATVCVFLGALVALGGAPAHADEDRVRVRSAGSFTAGRSTAGVTVEVRKRTDGCVRVRTALGLSLPGVRADQVAVQANVGGRWVPVGVSGAAGLVTTEPVAPARDELCKGKGVAMRYRVAFAATAPGGRLVVTGEATTARGAVLGRAAASSRVVGGRAPASPSPSPTPSPSPSTQPAEEPTAEATPSVALAAETTDDLTQTESDSSGGSPVMYFGIAMVAAGALLIGLLVYRSRKDRKDRGRPADGFEALPPRNPGGTTYRSGGGQGAAPVPPGPGSVPPVPPGQAYGAGRPATPRVYGGTPAPRPTGGLYGGRPADPSDATRPADPVEPTRPVPPGTSARAAVPSARTVPPTSAPPAPSAPGPVVPIPGHPPAPIPGPAGPTSGPPAAPPAGRPTGQIVVPPVEPGQGRVPGHPDGSSGGGKGDEPEYGRGLGG
ncbi:MULTISPECIES: hypothetical protein [unclassified Micromonospora]|uniref:hypothetical protein n=1 Tax=unclassified Micromonospora TaxID=2617518 RepID=UPI0022B64424|nr:MULTISPECIES: hypothetical protein [unclassified Micromonospora]MCZ7420793.1 hypothetical protein [Verrucosispora sp. WMMA2121]WBB88753.1 hypothetical protein O7597_17015 [Verrucosispora sp. WMMC514]